LLCPDSQSEGRVARSSCVSDSAPDFVLYIFAHTVPEIVPFLVFAVTGVAIPRGVHGTHRSHPDCPKS